jgi:hypothetical protein
MKDHQEPTHLVRRDRFALVFRVAGSMLGLVLMVIAIASPDWNSRWVIALFVLVAVGGALAYHLLTSLVRCPGCNGRVSNLRIAAEDARRKLFLCRRCGTAAWLREGFYWQRDFSG